MTAMTIRQAVPADRSTVVAILRSVQSWLRSRGIEQWPDGSPSLAPRRIGAQIGRGEFWIISEDLDPVAVIAISRNGDPDFWTPAELEDPAAYISKVAVLRRVAGRDIGELLLRWAGDHVAADAMWLRLDVWRANAELQDYYLRKGWRHIRTAEVPGRNSGALFEKLAMRNPNAASVLGLLPLPGEVPGRIEAGMPVIVPEPGGPVAADCVRITRDWSHGITEAGWEHGGGQPADLYEVRRNERVWVAYDAWPDPARAEACPVPD